MGLLGASDWTRSNRVQLATQAAGHYQCRLESDATSPDTQQARLRLRSSCACMSRAPWPGSIGPGFFLDGIKQPELRYVRVTLVFSRWANATASPFRMDGLLAGGQFLHEQEERSQGKASLSQLL